MVNLVKLSRSKFWHCWYYIPGTRRQRFFSCKTANKQEAKRFALDRLQQILQQLPPSPTPSLDSDSPSPDSAAPAGPDPGMQPEMYFLSSFIDDYIAAIQKTYTPKTISTIRDSLRQFKRRIGDRELQRIGVEECELFISVCAPSLATARKHYGHIRSAFEKAVVWKKIDTNPFRSFKKPKVAEVEMEFFRPADVHKLIRGIPEATYAQRRLRRIIVLTFETGLRAAEVRNLMLDAISIPKKKLTVRNTQDFTTKSKKNRAIPLTAAAIQAIEDQVKDTKSHNDAKIRQSRHLFPSRNGQRLSESLLGNNFARYCKLAFLDRPRLNFHSLRHGYGSRLAAANVPIHIIKKVMGHSSVTVTEQYIHAADSTVSSILEAIG